MCLRKVIIRSILGWMVLSIPFLVKGQQPITVSVFNQATTVPYTTVINTPIHPGVQVGTEFDWRQGRRFRLYPTINIGYMFHKHLFQGIYANAEIAFDFQTSFGLNVKSRLGLGYLRTYTTKQEYQLVNGRYESNKDSGNARFMPSFTLGLGYDVRKKDPYSPEIFILYQSWLEYPYSPGFIPLMAHTNFHLGTKFYTSKNGSRR